MNISRKKGFALLEPLVALAIFAIGIIIIARTLNAASAAQIDINQYSHSTWQLKELSQQMAANNKSNNYTTAIDCTAAATVNCLTATCNANQLSIYDRRSMACNTANIANNTAQGIFNSNASYLRQPALTIAPTPIPPLNPPNGGVNQSISPSFNITLTTTKSLKPTDADATSNNTIFVVVPRD